MPTARRLRSAAAGVVLALSGCSHALEPASLAPAPSVPLDSLELTLFLVGDAGSKVYEHEPVLQALARQLDSLRDAPRFVVFLGDNVYPRGIPPAEAPSRSDAERRIAAQVVVVRTAGARGLVVPGNHDWARQGPDGWNAIRRQDSLVQQLGGDAVRLLPAGGCPGPEVVDLGGHVRLIAMDSEWWVHTHAKPVGPSSPCATRSNQEVEDSLRGALRDRAKRVAIVVDHHPLRSGGEHGGAFTLGDHLFPLRNVRSWLWVPLPLVGSLYPLARRNGFSNQDVSGRLYQLMIAAFERAFADHPPLVMASGHDHDLQVIRGGDASVTSAAYQLVSGAGIVGHTGLVRKVKGSLFERDAAGFMRLDVTRGGRVRLSVTTVVRDSGSQVGASAEVFSRWLTDDPSR